MDRKTTTIILIAAAGALATLRDDDMVIRDERIDLDRFPEPFPEDCKPIFVDDIDRPKHSGMISTKKPRERDWERSAGRKRKR